MFKLFDLYIKSSIHVSLAVTAFVYVTLHMFNAQGTLALYLFIFCSTVVSYNFTKYLVLFQNSTVSAAGLLPKITVITVFALGGVIWSAYYLNLWVLSAALVLGIVTLAYGLPVFQSRINLRHIYGIKILVIAFVWAGVTVGLPLLNYDSMPVNLSEAAMVFTQRLFYVVALTLPFDIRDLQTDTPSLGTIPQIIGVKKTKILGSILLGSVLILEMFHSPIHSDSFFITCGILLLTGIAVWRSVKIQPVYFASFWVEGLPILWALLLFLF